MYSNFTSPASLLRRSSVGDGERLGFMLKMSKRHLWIAENDGLLFY